MKPKLKPESKDRGFTILEVLIALAIFAAFMASFVTSQGLNMRSSNMIREEIILRDLCANKLNEIILNPPTFREELTLTKDQKTFEDNPNYEYTIEYRKFELPDLGQLLGGEEDVDKSTLSETGESLASLQQKIFQKVSKSMEKMIWQVIVTITNKETSFSYDMSSWLYNPKAKIKASLQ